MIDGNTNTVTATVGVGTNPVALTVNPVTNKICVQPGAAPTKTVIDGGTHATSTVASGVSRFPWRSRVHQQDLRGQLRQQQRDRHRRGDNATNTVAVGTQSALAISMLGNTVFVANSARAASPLSTAASLTSANLWRGRRQPRHCHQQRGAGQGFVANGDSNDVTVITPGHFRLHHLQSAQPAVVGIPPPGPRTVANQGSNNLAVINSQSGTSTLAVGTGPAIGINPVTNRIHVVNTGSNDFDL